MGQTLSFLEPPFPTQSGPLPYCRSADFSNARTLPQFVGWVSGALPIDKCVRLSVCTDVMGSAPLTHPTLLAEVVTGQAEFIDTNTDRLDRTGKFDGVMFRFVCIHQEQLNAPPVTLRRAHAQPAAGAPSV